MSQFWWYLARATGLVAWGAAAASILVGLLMSTGIRSAKQLRETHNWLAGITVAMVALHLTGLWLDDYVDFHLVDFVVPGASEWRPAAVAWGVAGLYLLAAVVITSLLRRHMTTRTWRSVHLLSFVLFWVATVHAVTAGSDLGFQLIGWIVIGTTVLTTGLLLLRIAQAAVPGARARLARARSRRAASTPSPQQRPRSPQQRPRSPQQRPRSAQQRPRSAQQRVG